MLNVETHRPLRAQVAKHNPGSIRVLEKNGFQRVGEEPNGFLYELGSKPSTRP
jgi:RimJ/RimL family protein N-acetyltransferase